jgi:hypothetical protein
MIKQRALRYQYLTAPHRSCGSDDAKRIKRKSSSEHKRKGQQHTLLATHDSTKEDRANSGTKNSSAVKNWYNKNGLKAHDVYWGTFFFM